VNPLFPPPALDLLCISVPPALAGFVTVVLISVQWLAQLFADEDQSSKYHKSF
jgi:hypothetical protein